MNKEGIYRRIFRVESLGKYKDFEIQNQDKRQVLESQSKLTKSWNQRLEFNLGQKYLEFQDWNPLKNDQYQTHSTN